LLFICCIYWSTSILRIFIIIIIVWYILWPEIWTKHSRSFLAFSTLKNFMSSHCFSTRIEIVRIRLYLNHLLSLLHRWHRNEVILLYKFLCIDEFQSIISIIIAWRVKCDCTCWFIFLFYIYILVLILLDSSKLIIFSR
jgi:hypothetical protein